MLNVKAQEALDEVVQNWRAMQRSDMEDAADDADRFERSFYVFIDELKVWFDGLEKKPQSVDEAMRLPEVEAIFEVLDAPLHLNLETELELIVQGTEREADQKYD